jgi:hypothetical protein
MIEIRSKGSLGIPGALALILLALAGLAPAALAAEGERELDPLLSLIGGCKPPEALDPVEDPGCPTTPPADDHPPSTFSDPRAVTTDFYGNIYVSSFGSTASGSQGRIDIFGPDGVFISELKTTGPTSLAIDSEGFLYVASQIDSSMPIHRFTPCAPYDPTAGKIEYCDPPVKLAAVGELSFYTGLAINPANDHLFANFGSGGVAEYSSATEGNERIRSTKAADTEWGGGVGVAVDSARDLLYASGGRPEGRIDIFDLTSVVGAPPGEYEKIGAIEDSAVPGGELGFELSVAVDEGTGHVFVLDGGNCNLYEFAEDWSYLATIDFAFQCPKAGEIGVDNGPFSPNGKLGDGDKGRYLYVPSHEKGIGHSFAFFESIEGPPDVISTGAANISETEAELQAQINPGNLATTYTFEIKAEGASSWTLAGQGTIPAGNLDVKTTTAAVGLESGTSYRFRVVATNAKGSDEAGGSFATYPHVPVESATPCPNALLRTGPSALLPDCRAYELVTPPDTNGRAPLGNVVDEGGFTSRQVSPAGDKLPVRVEGGALPGLGGTGSLFGDPYVSSRTPSGWTTAYTGPSASEATGIIPGTTSPDQGYSFWRAEGSGSAVLGGPTNYLRFPDGHSEILGKGILGTDPRADGQLISENGDHIIFTTGTGGPSATAVQLEPEAGPDGTRAVYDRTPDGTTQVVSLKPGDAPFGAGEHAVYQGASLDGEGAAFEANNTLYLRYDNTETFEIGEEVDFAGVAEGGNRIFYVEAGRLWRFDALNGERTSFSTVAVIPVQVSADGTSAYFVSPSVLTAVANPNGAIAQAGKQNLYLSKEGQISFVGVVTDRDVEGEPAQGIGPLDGLGLWLSAVDRGRLADVPARTTPDGSVLLFKSRAALAGFDPEGHAQIYRYSVAGELQCLSCNPTGAGARSDATLQSERDPSLIRFTTHVWLENLRADGRRAFFESSEPLVARDTDGLQDVYEWEDEGVGSCSRPGGCVYLISSPTSLRMEYLWAVSRSGDDVFFSSSDRLVGADADETPSIYDARVGGGFPEPTPVICEGEGCRPQLTSPPALPATDTRARGREDNFKPRRCGKGKRKVKRAGKVRCVKKKKQRHRRADTNQRGARR